MPDGVTRISDLKIDPAVFAESVTLASLEKDAFIQSGVMVRDPMLDAFLSSPVGGVTINPRFVGALPSDDANVSSDDPETSSTPKKVTSVKNTAVRQDLNQSWSEMDLAVALYGSDPLGSLQASIAKYWETQRQRRLLASLLGIALDNIANDSSDMVVDISGESGALALFNADAAIDCRQTAGDLLDSLSVLAVHSTVYTTMEKNDLIDTIPDSEGKPIRMYRGMNVIVDDAMTTVAGSPLKYYSWMFGPGAIAFGAGSPKVPFEVLRTPAAGNGGGQETVFSRVEYIIHPQGFECTLTSTPTIAQLKLATSWNRAFERKRVPLACLISAG